MGAMTTNWRLGGLAVFSVAAVLATAPRVSAEPLALFTWTQCDENGQRTFGVDGAEFWCLDSAGAVFGITNLSNGFALLDLAISVEDTALDLTPFAADGDQVTPATLPDGDLAPGLPGVFLFFAGLTGNNATLSFGLSPRLPPGFVVSPALATVSSDRPVFEVTIESAAQPIPEPATLSLLASGLVLSALRRRRSR
jgi:hypothetical protein